MGFGGISVGGLPRNRMYFGQLLGGVDHLPHIHDPVRNGFARGQPAHGAELTDALERITACSPRSTDAHPINTARSG